MRQQSRKNFTKKNGSPAVQLLPTFLIAFILKKNMVRPRIEPQTLGYKSDGGNSRPFGKEPGGCEGSIEKQVEKSDNV